jgi:subtilase family serine protease
MRNFLLCCAATCVALGCADSASVDGQSGPMDPEAAALSAIPSYPHAAACSGGAFRCFAEVRTTNGTIQPFATVTGFGPADLASAYALNTSVSTNATIALVDAFGYPNAESDLATYRSNFGLPACSVASGCLTIVNQNGQTSPLPPAPTATDDWTVETALDLDMASSACPSCKILLVQASDDTSDGLFIAQQTAVSLGATVVSNSWGGPETSFTVDGGQPATAFEHYFDHPGVGTFVASGDNGYDDNGAGPDYPGTSQYVTAVGGTSLTKAAGTARGWAEKAWGLGFVVPGLFGAGGSACSLSIPKPSWQPSSTTCSFKASSDVAAVGDPSTGLAVYNNGPSVKGWIEVGGTSAATPFTAGVYALTGHGGDTPQFAYANTGDFYDVTTGTNAAKGCPIGSILCHARAGWDGPTGNGTPNGKALAGTTCTPQCSGKQCGSDGCGGVCGTCPSGESCNSAGQCVAGCTPQCTGKQCGPDGCGGVCGTCASGDTCNSTGQCVAQCVPSCQPWQHCGNDGCGGQCGGGCQTGQFCFIGFCL